MQYFNTIRENIDLLIDPKEIKKDGMHYRKYFNFSQTIKGLAKWRNFIFACGAFPENLSECALDEPKLIPRTEWMNWLEIQKGDSNPRVIRTFGWPMSTL